MAVTREINDQSHVYLVDGSGYIFRAYHALPPLTRSDGTPVGAVQGFCNMLWKLLEDLKGPDEPSHIAVIFDAKGPTFRSEIYPEYKANRPPAPEDLVPQFGLIREATRAFDLPCIELEGFEADDIIATYACQARDKGARVTIVSSDKDLMQLVDDKITLFDTMKNKRSGPDEVREKFGVGPDRVIDVQSLAGDSVDNVPGVPGIGIKTAAQLIETYGDLEGLLSRVDEIKQPKRREKLTDHAEDARVSRQLVTLKQDVPLDDTLEQFGAADPEPDHLLPFMKSMEFRTLSRRVQDLLGADAAVEADDPEAPIDRSVYETVQDEAALKVWIDAAKHAHIVAVDVETDALSASSAGLVGISLAIAPGKACYIPLDHLGGDLADGGGRPEPSWWAGSAGCL